jgi:hypothetical protein
MISVVLYFITYYNFARKVKFAQLYKINIMKKIAILIVCLLFGSMNLLAQNDNVKAEDVQKPVIKFDKTTHDYGEIAVNSDGTCEFEFENTGKAPLLLTKVRSSCGCTTPKWPKEPLKPGDKETIKVKYNTRIKGSFSKTIWVYSNADNSPLILRIKGKVAQQNTSNN